MPIYDYQCQDCNNIFDVRASIKEKIAGLHSECPLCHSPETRQMLTAGFLLNSQTSSKPGDSSACGPNAGPGCCGG
jgi:putative FmdB family regulatory protein